MSWWTEPDEGADRRASPSAPTARIDTPSSHDAPTEALDASSQQQTAPTVQHGEAVTVSHDLPDHSATPDTATRRLDSADAPTTPIGDEQPTRTQILPTALIPNEGPPPNDLPTVAVPRSTAAAPHARRPQRIAGGVPIEYAPMPYSPQEVQAARSHRAGRRRLTGFGWLRLLLGQVMLAAGVVLVAAGLAPVEGSDLAAAWNLVTQVGLGVLLVAWIVLPGPIGGTIAAIVLTGVVWVTMLVGLWVLGTEQLQTTIGAPATSIIVNWVVPIVVLMVSALCWILARGKHPASVIVLVIPIVVAIAAGLVVPDGWIFGTLPSEWWTPVTEPIATTLAGWSAGWPELAASIADGVDGWVRIAAAVLPAMLLAWPLRSTNTALRR